MYVEVDDQLYSRYNCFSLAELTRASFRIFDRDKEMIKIGEVKATFDVDDEAFEKLRQGLVHVFRAYPNFHILEHR